MISDIIINVFKYTMIMVIVLAWSLFVLALIVNVINWIGRLFV